VVEALKAWLSQRDPGALLVLGFVVLVVFLSVYAFRHWAKRKKALLELMPTLGFTQVGEPRPGDLIPDLLFHPNEFEGPQPGVGLIQDLHPRVTLAWTGTLADRTVTVMDVSVARIHGHRANEERTGMTLNRTVLRCPTPSGEPPPDFLLTEKVLFKGQVEHHRAVRGVETFGKHYFLFSEAPDDQLARWISPLVEVALGRHRLWTIAAHGGVLYMCRGTKHEEAHEIESFLSEGEEFLRALLPGMCSA
jgi:hypothetical protein